jgi:DNA-binding NtrC family response regulator
MNPKIKGAKAMNIDSVEGRVLLVEDRADWRKQLTKYLRQEGYFFETATTFDTALSLLGSEPFDLILVDLRLVDWDDQNFQGMELLPRISELRKENGTQAIIVTAHPTPENVREAFRDRGVADFFIKSDLDPQGFKDAVRKAVVTAYEERHEILKTK